MKLNIFKTALIAAAVAIGFAACSDKEYWEPYQPDGVKYSFTQKKLTKEYELSTDPDLKGTGSVMLRRSDAGPAVKLALEYKAITNNALTYYELPDSVEFEAGSYAAEINFVYLKNMRNQHRRITISIPDSITSISGFSSIELDCYWVNPK